MNFTKKQKKNESFDTRIAPCECSLLHKLHLFGTSRRLIQAWVGVMSLESCKEPGKLVESLNNAMVDIGSLVGG